MMQYAALRAEGKNHGPHGASKEPMLAPFRSLSAQTDRTFPVGKPAQRPDRQPPCEASFEGIRPKPLAFTTAGRASRIAYGPSARKSPKVRFRSRDRTLADPIAHRTARKHRKTDCPGSSSGHSDRLPGDARSNNPERHRDGPRLNGFFRRRRALEWSPHTLRDWKVRADHQGREAAPPPPSS